MGSLIEMDFRAVRIVDPCNSLDVNQVRLELCDLLPQDFPSSVISSIIKAILTFPSLVKMFRVVKNLAFRLSKPFILWENCANTREIGQSPCG